jgi:hypothetical protein
VVEVLGEDFRVSDYSFHGLNPSQMSVVVVEGEDHLYEDQIFWVDVKRVEVL